MRQTKRSTRFIRVFLCVSMFALGFSASFRAQPRQLKPIEVEALNLGPEAEQQAKKYEKRVEEIRRKYAQGVSLSAEEKAIFDREEENSSNDTSYGSVESGEECGWYCGTGWPISMRASSTLPKQGRVTYEASQAHDLNYITVWAEGAKGDGVGEWLEYTMRANCSRITRIIVAPGHVKSAQAWRNNSRPKQLRVSINGEPRFVLNLLDQRAKQIFDVDTIQTSFESDWTIRFEILSVYKGAKWDDVVISEICFDGIDVHCFPGETRVLMGDGSERSISAVSVGDMISYRDATSGILRVARVESVARARHGELVQYRFSSGRMLRATRSHPVRLESGEWASMDPAGTRQYAGYASVSLLRVGARVQTTSGIDTLESIETIQESVDTYTITKTSAGDNFVAGGVVVGIEGTRKRDA